MTTNIKEISNSKKKHFDNLDEKIRDLEGFILGPLVFLIYINYLPSELCCSPKLFADDTSKFSVVKNVNETAK